MLSSEKEKEDIAVTNFRRYLRIDTEQPKPDYAKCTQFLFELADELGWKRVSHEVIPGIPIVIMTIPGKEPSLPSLMLYSHTDVVPTFKDHWTHDPYSAFKDSNGDIYGRGAQDMKSVGIQYIEALRRLKLNKGKSQFKRTIHLVFGPDEEIGGDAGLGVFVKRPEFDNLNIGFSLDEGIAVPEDTYPVYYSERLIWWMKVICRGAPGHGSKFIDDTAPEKLQRVLNSFYEYRRQQHQLLIDNPELILGDVSSVNLTKVEGGVQSNCIPAEMIAWFDVRVTPTDDCEAFENQIKKWCQQAGNNVTYEFIQVNRDPRVTSLGDDNRWWTAMKKTLNDLGCKYRTSIFFGGTDGRFVREKNIPVIGFSPMIHTPQLLHDHNEFLNEKVYLRGVEIYEALIENLADCV